jgi:adenosylcobinamide-GDP ribazoletransferase
MMIPGTRDDWARWLAERAGEIKTGILFSTRLPFAHAAPSGGADFTQGALAKAVLAQALWALPLAGIVVGLIGAAVYALAHRLGLPAWPAAALCVAATMALTGALHEDGLADTIDGFGGGETRERKLDIMRDSRIGVYGVCALAVSILIRVSALASLADTGLVALAVIAAHGAGRATLPVFMYFVPPARADGLSFAAGLPSREQAAAAGVLGILILAVCLGFEPALVAAILLAIVVALVARLSLAQIGGQTGDVLGALEQASEILILLVALR